MDQNDGKCSGSAFGQNFVESLPQPFPRRRRSPERNFPDSSSSYCHRHYPIPTDVRPIVRPVNSEATSASGDDSWSFVIVLILLAMFALAVICGVYSSETLQLGPNSSVLINPSHLFVESVKVEGLDAAKGSVLYGFYEKPPLNVVVNWSETHNVTLPASTHKEWVYHLNERSRINISYTVESSSSSPLVLVIARGKGSLSKWLEDPSDPSTTFSWNMIHGEVKEYLCDPDCLFSNTIKFFGAASGSIQMDVSAYSDYYMAVGNLNSKVVEVQLETRIKAFLYNTREKYYECTPLEVPCSFQLPFLGGDAAVLSSPGRKSGNGDGYWRVRLSYGTRWFTYLVGLGGVTLIALCINRILKHWQSIGQERRTYRPGGIGSERNPLLSREDNGLSGRSSVYPSAPQEEEEHVKDALAGVDQEGEPATDQENLSQSECAICFDARRDCFFIPCGHCVACFGCATRIVEASGTCPVCRQPATNVRKIYTV